MILTPRNLRLRDNLRRKTVWDAEDRATAALIGYDSRTDSDGPWGEWQPWRDFDASIYSSLENAKHITVWNEEAAAKVGS